MSNHHLIEKDVVGIQPAHIKGTLYHLAYGYPGLVLDDQHEVSGEILTLKNEKEALPILDKLEDFYGPGHPDNHYERREVTIDGVSCYVYEWVLPLDQIAQFVPGQDWRAFKRERGE